MRWVAGVFALGVTMAVLHHFTAASPLAARATLALGWLLLASWLGGELARRRNLPLITGALLVGFSIGPNWLNLVRPDELDALQLLTQAGVALFAFAAGSELRRATRNTEWRALARVAGTSATFPLVATTAVMLSVSPWFPLTVHRSFGDALAVALVLGTVAAAASPVLGIATLDAKGLSGEDGPPLGRTIVALAAMQDVLVSAGFVLVLVLALPLASPGALNVAAVRMALGMFGGSVAAGAALGILITEYGKVVRIEEGKASTALLVTIGLVTAWLAQSRDLEPVLVALALGFTVEHLGPAAGTSLRRAAGEAWLPLAVLVFGLAGAGLSVDALGDLWPWVFLLVSLRAVALRHGVRWAVQREPEGGIVTQALAREGWLGLISQSGVVLGLAPLVRRALPATGVSLEALIVATVAVHELVGPVCFRRALGWAGELKEGESDAEGTGASRALVGAIGRSVR